MTTDGPAGRSVERQRIDSALIELVSRDGFAAVSLEELLRHGGVSRTAFFRHYKSLEDCFESIWAEVDAELRLRMTAAYRSESDWPDRLRNALRAGLDYLAAEEGRARLYVDDALYINGGLRERHQATIGRLAEIIELGREEPGGDRSEPNMAEAISGAIWHRVNQLLRSGRGAELPGELPKLMYFAVLSYRGKSAAEAELRRSH